MTVFALDKKTVKTTGTNTDEWRKKYFDSLGSLETAQTQARAMEASLRRLVGRLCTASLGQSPGLDEQLKRLQKSLRQDASLEEIDQITPALSDAIQALDHSPSARPAAAVSPAPVPVPPQRQPTAQREAASDEPVRAILAALLTELRRDSGLHELVDALDAKLAAPLDVDQLSQVLSGLTDVVGQRIQRIERSKQEIETLLAQMVGKLDEIGQFVAEQNQNQSLSQASSDTLSIQLVGEMKAMGESVEAASDLLQIRTQVRSRLESIDHHLQEFKRREATRATAMQARNEQMRARVAMLESETSKLRDQLQDEQRLSTIDTLTKIPNRLAYEKRIEEELQRWQRFKQPTCIAVWDVDHFKRINDGCGHRAGDQVLSTVADCLSRKVRSTDFLARYGGEEFIMILSGTGLEDAVRLVDEMRVSISRIGFHFRGNPLTVTVSCGVTALLSSDSASGAFDRADRAMYQAKEGGRNRCVSLSK